MSGRILSLGVACAMVVARLALAQSNLNTGETSAVDESQPPTVVTPSSDVKAKESSEPLAPQASAEKPPAQEGTPMQPEPVQPAEVLPAEEAAAVDQAVIPVPSRKLWRISPLFAAGVYYDDNIFLSETDRVSDVVWTLAGGLAFELGDFRRGEENYLTAKWIGAPVFYTNNPEENGFNQSASLRTQYRWNRLVGRFDSNFSITREANRETNTITTTQSFSNDLRFSYDYSGKTTFFVAFSQLASVVESFQNTYQYEAKGGVDYRMLPKTTLGFEGVGGVLVSPSSPLQYYQQGRLRVSYAYSEKLNFNFSGGIEVREFEGEGSPKVNPVFGLGMSYHPFDGTTLNLGAYRNVVGSDVQAGQDYIATGFVIAAQQRFFQKFIATLTFGFENDTYFATSDETSIDRVDNYLYVRPSLRYSFVRWVSANLFYEYRNTASNQETRSFYANRIGIEMTTSF